MRCLGTMFGWNFCHRISFDILVKICLQNSVTKVPLKNYTPRVSIPQTNLYQNLKRNWDVWGISFFFWGGGDFCHQISFKILPELCLQNSVTKVPLKNYTPGVNSTNKSLPKFEKNLRCLGYNFWEKTFVTEFLFEILVEICL